MAGSATDHAIPQAKHAARPQVQHGPRGAPSDASPPAGGPSPDSISPSPPPVRVHELAALPHRGNRAPTGEERGHRYPDGGSEAPQLQDERFCIVLWVVGSSIAFPLVLSGWLFLVPFVAHADWTATPPFSASPQPSASTMPSSPSTLAAATSASTSSWQYIPSTCIAPVTLPALPARLNVSAPYSFGPSNASSRPIFCLYNNTRVNAWRNLTNSQWNYVFAILPFALCPYVIYWSVGIENGNITSRQPGFDEQHGVHRLRAVADSLNFHTVKILLALGGYPEDAPHFSRLGWDQDTADRLLHSVVDSLSKFRLNGIAVHWVTAHAGCQGPDDVTALNTFLHRVRTRFNTGTLQDAMVTVILERNNVSRLVAQEAADVVDHFFLATRTMSRSSGSNIGVCEARTKNLHRAYRSFADALPAQKLRRSQLCLTDSLMAWAVKGSFIWPGRFRVHAGLEDTPIHVECSWPNVCALSRNESCPTHLGKQVAVGNDPDWLFAVDGVDTLQKRVDFSHINATQLASVPGDPVHACVLLLDLDADNYVDQCGDRYPRYVLMRNYYYGTMGKTPSGGSDFIRNFGRCY